MTERKTIPNFFIVGAAKAGTTSLYHYLKSHPQVFFSPIKEPNYFASDIRVEDFCTTYRMNTFLDVDTYFRDQPLKEIQLSFVKDHNQYLSLFDESSNEKIVGECSTSYLYSSEAANQIKRYNPEARIVIVLRNPVERTFSHYQMALRYGHTNLNFRKAIDKDLKQKKKGWGISELFIELSMYEEQIKRYLELFPADQLKILYFDDLKERPVDLLDELTTFLGINPIENLSGEKYNVGSIPRFKKLNTLVARSGIREIVKKSLGPKPVDTLKKTFYKKGNLPELRPDERRFLNSLFKEDVLAVSKLLDRDLGHWID